MAGALFPDPALRRPAPWPALEHGLVGNGRVLALVAPDSGVEWLCLPTFDSPSVFAALLDRDRGGVFRVRFRREARRGQMAYLANTNVLVTRFAAEDCEWEVVDFAPRYPDAWGVRVPREIVRLVRPLAGQPTLSVELVPRPDYARVSPELLETTRGVEIRGGRRPLHLTTNLPVPYLLGQREFVLARPLFFVLADAHPSEVVDLPAAEHALLQTATGWRATPLRR
jgi:hypothetical protein